jgi:hypothetical protein
VLAAHVSQMKYAGLDAAIASWWGPTTPTGNRLPLLLDAAAAQDFAITAYYEREGTANPTAAEVRADLATLSTSHPAWLKIGGKPVIFVYNANDTTCAIVDKWRQAAPGWYLQMKVFRGYATCPTQPDSWHQYGPAVPYETHGSYHANVSPGFWHHTEATPRLARDLTQFKQNLSRLADAAVAWQLITSFNEWGEGTSVEPATQWQSASGMGDYLDAMRDVFVKGQRSTRSTTTAPPASTTTTAAPPPTTTVTTTTTTTAPPTTTTTNPPPAGAVTIAAAGDIACDPARGAAAAQGNGTDSCAHNKVAQVIQNANVDAVLTLGDNQYEQGSLAQYKGSYDITAWSALKAKTYPAPGNHEWLTGNAQGYKDYFASGTPPEVDEQRGYYSFNLGAWHLVSLDSDCGSVGGCGTASPMYRWLVADLAANNGKPTLLYWHHPRFTSGPHTDTTTMSTIWDLAVADRDVQLVLTGHDHSYERFAPMGNTGPSPTGLRQFKAGTGGKNHTCPSTVHTGSEVRNCTSFGALKVTLIPDGGYTWQFLPATGSFTDTGTQARR